MIHQLVEQGILSAEDERDKGFGIKIKLQQGMELSKDFNSHEVGFINDQDRLLFSARDFRQKRSEGLGEKGDGKGTGLYLEGKQDLLEDFENRSGIGGYGKDPVLRGMKGSGGVPEGSGADAGVRDAANIVRGDQDPAEPPD